MVFLLVKGGEFVVVFWKWNGLGLGGVFSLRDV